MEYLNHRSQVLYLRGLRRFMDFSTGIVGDRRGVSFQMMRELLEVSPDRGSRDPVYKPTVGEVRASLAQLERAGLIRRLPKLAKTDRMRFYLPLASIRPNEERQMNDKGGTTKEVLGTSIPYVTGTTNGERGMNDIPPVSGKTSCDDTRAREGHGPGVESPWPRDHIPMDRSEWGRVLASFGFSQERVFTAKTLPMLKRWVDSRVTVGEFEDAAQVANCKIGGQPASVAYYDWAVNEVMQQRNSNRSGGQPSGEGKRIRESGASVLARGCAAAFEKD